MNRIATIPVDPKAWGWREEVRVGFIDTVGPVWCRSDGEAMRFGFVVQSGHLNGNGTVHGGMLLSLLDHALGMAVGAVLDGRRAATVQLGAQFLGAAHAGDFIETRATMLRRTRSLLFMRGECLVGDAVIVAGEGVFKVLSGAAAQRRGAEAEPEAEKARA